MSIDRRWIVLGWNNSHGKTFKGILLMIIGILFAVCPFVNGYNKSTGGNLTKELMEYKL